jgi:hypothetical protein
MKKLFLILMCCFVATISTHQTMAGDARVAKIDTEYDIFAANFTDGHLGIYFTGINGGTGTRGYVEPHSSNKLGPVPEGTYSVLITTNAGGTHTFCVNGQCVTNDNGQATFTVDVNSSVYITVE